MPQYKLSEIAKLFNLTLQGDDIEVVGVNTLQNASPNEISFLANAKYIHQLALSQAGAIILSKEYAGRVPRALISTEPYRDFGRVLSLFSIPQGCFEGISHQTYIHPTAQVSKTATIYPFVFIGSHTVIKENTTLFPGVYIGENCYVGKNCTIYPNSVLMANTSIGNDCIIHAGVVLGSDGFGFALTEEKQKIPQVGNVVIKDKVEIGANTTVDRGTLGTTTINENTKIDNLVQIGHGVTVGKNTVIVSQVGISGSTSIGDNCILAGQAGVSGHLTIGNNVTIGPQSGIGKNIPDNQILGGSPAVDRQTFLKTAILMPRFPELFKRIKKLEKILEKKKEHNI